MMTPEEFVKSSKGRCYLQGVKINGQYVQKAFCNRCPSCGKRSTAISDDGSESCIKGCGYERQVFTPEELEEVYIYNDVGGVRIVPKDNLKPFNKD